MGMSIILKPICNSFLGKTWMKKRANFLIVLIIIFGVGISFFMYFPKSIENALNRIKYPFEVGEILASQQIDENLTAVIYTNKEEKSNLQNAIVRKRGIFYDVIETNGSVHIEKPKQLESGQLRTQVLISWYDKSDKYVIMAVAYDEDVSTITYLNQELIQLNVNGYRLFLGYGIGEYDEMHMFDKNGNCLEQIKE